MQPIFIDKISRFCLLVLSLIMGFATFACFYLSLSQLKGIGFALPLPSAIAGVLAVTVLVVLAEFRNRIADIFQQIQRAPYLFEAALALGIAIRIAWWPSLCPRHRSVTGTLISDWRTCCTRGRITCSSAMPSGRQERH
jgi:hypothetical protein